MPSPHSVALKLAHLPLVHRSVVQASPSLQPTTVSSSTLPSQSSSLPLQSSLEAIGAAHSGKGPTAVQLRLAEQVPATLVLAHCVELPWATAQALHAQLPDLGTQ